MSDRVRPVASESAWALALSMRAFDASLDDDEIVAIARGIDAARGEGRALSNDPHRLRNGDEPATTFAVDPR